MRFARVCVGLVVFALITPVAAISAQTPSKRTWAPSILAGPSSFIGDFGEGGYQAWGGELRVGAAIPGFDLGLALGHWPEVGGFSLTTAQFEAAIPIGESQTISPELIATVGYTSGKYLGTGIGIPPNGASAGFGLGLFWRAPMSVGLRTAGFIRTDDGGWNAQLRFLGGWMPPLESRPLETGLEIEAFWLIPFSGPWEFVQPAYSMGLSRPVTNRVDGSLAIALVHWRIPTNDYPGGEYLWDTGMVVVLPAAEWALAENGFSVRAGPSIAAMGEGPDNGVSFGAHARTTWEGSAAGLPLTLGIGSLWLALDGSHDSRVEGADQVGLTLHAGVLW